MKETISFIIKLTLLPFYYISKIMPRNRNLWLFGEANGFNNNSKYIYFEFLERYPEIQSVWIGDIQIVKFLRSKGLPAFPRNSIYGMWLCLRAKFYVVSSTQGDINFYTSGGATIINLWHGVGWKACLWSNPLHSSVRNKNIFIRFSHFVMYPHLYFKPDIVLSTSSDMTNKFFSPMFAVDRNKCIEAVYPRCSFMLQNKTKIIEHIRKYETIDNLKLIDEIKSYSKVIIYAPTFRDTGEDFLSVSGIDFCDLNEFCLHNNYIFIVKCHPATIYNVEKLKGLSNILFLDKRFDLYLLMPFSDTLISDYSSIAIDYLLLSKQLIFYPFDLERYNSNCREFVFDYKDSIKESTIVYKYKDLKSALSETSNTNNSDLLKRFWNCQNNSIDTIMMQIEK